MTTAQRRATGAGQQWYRRLQVEAEQINCRITRGPQGIYVLRGERPGHSTRWADSLADLEDALTCEREMRGEDRP